MLLHDALRGAVKRCLEYLIPYWESHCKAVEEKLEGLLEEDLKSNEKLTAEEKKLFPQREEKKEDLEWSWERWKQHICEIEENERVLQALKVINSSCLISRVLLKLNCWKLIRQRTLGLRMLN